MEVREDPRLDVTAGDRDAWTETLLAIGALFQRAAAVNATFAADADAGTADDRRQAEELQSRLSRLYGQVEGYTGRPTADQRSQIEYYGQVLERLERNR